MDLVCSRCGEPWDLYYVLHEEPEAFERDGSLILRCPACRGDVRELSEEMEIRAKVAGVIADVLGDDVDGAAVMMEDYL